MLRLLWPLVLEQIFAVTIGMADTFMVSSVGEYAVSGVNVVDTINNFLVIVLISLSTGGAVVVSQYIGRKDNANVSLAAKQLIYIVVVISILITLFTLILRAPILKILYGQLESDVMNAALIYFFITALSYPMLGMYNACAALYRAAGNSQASMRVSLFTNILHIGLNALFIFGFGMGVMGAALSTLITRTIAAFIIFMKLLHDRRVPITLTGILEIKLIPSMIKRILGIGIPGGLESSLFQFGRLMTQRIFPYYGTSIIAANAVTGVINGLAFQTGNAFSVALITVVGQCIGAGDIKAAERMGVKLIKITWTTVSTIAIFLLIFNQTFIGLFNLSPEAQAAAKTFIIAHSLSTIIGWTLAWALPSALRAAGDAKFIMVVGVLSTWIVRVCGSYLLCFVFNTGPIGVWLAMGADFLVRGFFFTMRWKSGKWQKLKVISD